MSDTEALLGAGGRPIEPQALGYIYLSHLVSTFGDRMWQFAIPIIFMEIWPNTLFPCSLFLFVNNLAQFILMPTVGAWSDRHQRRLVMRTALIGQNAAIAACSVVLLLLVYTSQEEIQKRQSFHWRIHDIVAFSCISVLSILGELLGKCSTNALEKDWVVVICQGQSAALAKTNARMRAIDLGSKVLAPLAFSVILECFNHADSALRLYISASVVGLWNLLSLPLEYITVMSAYQKHIDKLSVREQGSPRQARSRLRELGIGWRKYIHHPVFLASVSYCMLYLTVLDNGILMIAYLNYRKVPKVVLGVTRGAGAVVGLLGTFAYPSYLACNASLRRAAWLSLGLFAVFISPAAVFFSLESVFEPENKEKLAELTPYVMMLAVNLSRCWLWMFDLGENQLLQEMVDEAERGLIASVQNSTCQVGCNSSSQQRRLRRSVCVGVRCAARYSRYGFRGRNAVSLLSFDHYGERLSGICTLLFLDTNK